MSLHEHLILLFTCRSQLISSSLEMTFHVWRQESNCCYVHWKWHVLWWTQNALGICLISLAMYFSCFNHCSWKIGVHRYNITFAQANTITMLLEPRGMLVSYNTIQLYVCSLLNDCLQARIWCLTNSIFNLCYYSRMSYNLSYCWPMIEVQLY